MTAGSASSRWPKPPAGPSPACPPASTSCSPPAPCTSPSTGQALSLHPETTFSAAVTGAANLLVTVTCRTTEDLYSYVTGKIGALPAVHQVEIVPVLHQLKQSGTLMRNGRLVLDQL
ncbi:Lrp/AsnC ligand binding domain-containing protein [Amycolatopsis kentuckyensis]|uniref:Lrp/AsnC ligand binding domain-containing protein n=1 Tax=Amycolatopsis kentuckyensis TaxID=218823 RepID=UPI003569E339